MWLKYYVMMRLIDRSKPRGSGGPMPAVICFLVSSVWHGLELGLTICMFGFGLLLAVYKSTINTKLVALICKYVPFYVYHPFKFFFFFYFSSYYEICFELRWFSVFWKVHGDMYYLGAWLPPLIVIIGSFLPKVKKPRSNP